ncbi:uncharacterized protein LOC105699624 [Orussus abietinus]|uniref:uncharacterized protein LOC105699624 n=1 Tax=Orussus abietinus TaxID=222816 RepID=UPI000625A341|nr:uncharacterized protein LOC105699624 [Orussus abietinus]
MKTILCVVLIGIATADVAPYRPRGWRPEGRSLSHGRLRSQLYGPPSGFQKYGPPDVSNHLPESTTTTRSPPTTTSTTTTTTPKSREPTTEPDIPQEEFEVNPALAIANSFAFNRPVYVYNTFPFHPAYAIVK